MSMDIQHRMAEWHLYYDTFPGGVCLISADREERILFANAQILALYQCGTREELDRLTGGTFAGMSEREERISLAEMATKRLGDGPEDYQFISFQIVTARNHFRRVEGAFHRCSLDGEAVWFVNLVNSEVRSRVLENDQVTGLMGVHAFLEEAERREKQEAGQNCPVYFNLTNFKVYNSTHGILGGDRILQKIAQILQESFKGAPVAHMSADNFAVLARQKNVVERVEAVCRRVDAHIGNPSVVLKAGLCLFDSEDEHTFSARSAFDMAKVACDSVKNDANRSWAIYTKHMSQSLERKAYILENFSRALENGYIKTYYQPVVRILTGKLCGLEALARWEDPEYGRLTPDVFIPTLEQARLIHRLDAYMVRQVCRLQRERMEGRLPVVPISFNLSRLDFGLMDCFEMVEQAVQEYDIPRDYLRVEITETALVEEDSQLSAAIERFRKAGYQVWLDDFGSGYSSLNVLNRFRFDELKIDMGFMRNFNEQSKKIVTSIVLMAKTLGVHTLAEGVEDAEQIRFLKSIGCEKIQGYYYGRPLVYEDCIRHCRERRLWPESRLEEYAYDQVGLINVITDSPVGIFLDDGDSPVILNENEAYRRVMQSTGTKDIEEANRNLSAPDLPMRLKYRSFMDRAIASGRRETMTYVDNGQYIRIRLKVMASAGRSHLGKVEVFNITDDGRETKGTEQFDNIFRHILQIYDGIYYFHMESDVMEVVETMNPMLRAGERVTDTHQLLRRYAEQFIHRGDLARFYRFAQEDRVYEEAVRSSRSEAEGLFRVKQPDGSYRWKIFDAIVLYKTADKDILLCVRDGAVERMSDWDELMPAFMASYGFLASSREKEKEELWKALIGSSGIRLFWKDRQRRFLGVSQAFLDYYGMDGPEKVLGKTDEEMAWHINAVPYRNDEEAVIEKGETVRGSVGECIARGVPRRISATKFPVYRGNHIIGLMGYFRDLDEEMPDQSERLGLTDPETGLLSYRGMLMTGLAYVDNYRQNGEDYGAVLMEVPKFDQICASYGRKVREGLLKRIAQIILEEDFPGGSVARLGGATFLLFHKTKSREELSRRLTELSRRMQEITRIRGCRCTIRFFWALAKGTEGESLDQLLHLLQKRLDEARGGQE